MLGRTVIMTNRTGGVGAIGMKFVQSQKSDGYTLLMGAENPLLYKVMGLSDNDYSDFTAINMLARGVPILVANKDAPFNTVKEMEAYAKANPGKVKFGSTGPGGLPVGRDGDARHADESDLTAVPYDGDGPALTALQGGAHRRDACRSGRCHRTHQGRPHEADRADRHRGQSGIAGRQTDHR